MASIENPKDNSEAANNNNNFSKSREEGELSSDDDEECPGGSASRFTGITTSQAEHVQVDSRFTGSTVSQAEHVRVASVSKNTRDFKAGNYVSTSNPASFAGAPSRTSVQPNHHKNFEKNRGPFVPFLISFSDDDSGSESEDRRQRKALESKGNTLGVNGSRRPPAASLVESQNLEQATRNQTKVMPRKVHLSRTFVSSPSSINGATSTNSGTPLVEQKSRIRKFNNLNKKLAVGEHESKQNVHVNTSKLQDLRQQIIIRENELKLKAAQQNKETVAGSCRDYHVINFSNDTARTCRATSTDNFLCEPKEPDKKRLKVSEPRSRRHILDGQQNMPAVESTLASVKSMLENCTAQIVDDCSHHDKDIPLGRMHSSIARWQKQDENHRGLVSSENLPTAAKEGTDIITNGSLCDTNIKLVDHSIPSEQSPRGVNRNKAPPKKSSTVELKHSSDLDCRHTQRSVQNNATSRHSLTSEFPGVKSGDKVLKPMPDDVYQSCSLHVPDSNLETSNMASLDNASLCHCLGKVNISRNSNMDMQSIMDIEEMQDKELEEAQDHRRKCEIEERSALRAYRKAQRDLIEANARCSYLYRRRELCSAHFRSLMMDGSSLFCSSRPQNHVGVGLNLANNMSEVITHVVPPTSHQMLAKLDIYDQQGGDLNVQSANVGALQDLSDGHVDGQILAPDPCSEPDVSTSDQKDNGVANVVRSPSNDLDISADEDEETFLSDHGSDQSNLDSLRKKETCEARVKDTNDGSKRRFSFDGSQDSLLLEASLRSQLFARLGMKTLSNKRGRSQSMEHPVESGAENNDGRENREINMGSMPFSEAEKDLCSDLEGHESKKYASLLCPILRSAFGHMKVFDPIDLICQQSRNQEIQTAAIYDKNGTGVGCNDFEPSSSKSKSFEENLMGLCIGEVGSYTCNLAIDPLLPLCMYELRGKCNNVECSWQHVRDYSDRKVYMYNSDDHDCQVGSTSPREKICRTTNLSKCHESLALAPPTYLVCLDNLKADLHSYKSVLAQGVGQCWQKNYSASLVLSCLLPTDLPSDEPFLHGNETRIEVHGAWNRQSLYLHSRNGTLSQLDQHLADNEQYLEMALLNLNQEANKQKGRIEALKVLARALETDPTSVVLWIVYLHIYYCNQKSVGKDDMFQLAVEHNEGSYELWLMYINSRIQFEDRLVAYDIALSALCRLSSNSDRDAMHGSEYILDLFLQMMNSLSISGKFSKIIEKIYGLFPSWKKSDEPGCLPLSDILTCLTIGDKCIFWICCVYLVVYRKLPDVVVQQFECQKELSAIEWPSVHLTNDKKQLAVTLMEMAVDSLALYIDSESLESAPTLKAAHMFAVNHIRCISVFEGLEFGRNLLDKYTKLYPSCFELILMSARVLEHGSVDSCFLGFEEALSNWLEDVPGVQCIWNQYAECALQIGRFDFVKELMDRWYHSVWKVQHSQGEILDSMDGENFNSSPESALDVWVSISSQIDAVFGLLNLALYKILQDNHTEARLAFDRALKAATAEDYKHCLREHVMFLLTDVSQYKKDTPISAILNVLNLYLVDAQAFHAAEPLSRRFIHRIKKPRVQQLVSNVLSPLSSDCSTVNLVLEVWYGPSLLPKMSPKLSDLVDLVEAILEIMPSNYQLAISVCKLLSRGSKSTSASASISFWASSLLVNAFFQAVPVAPEYVWVEAAGILHNLTDIQSVSESFHRRALSVYPFSINLWKSYLNFSTSTGNANSVMEAARERGIILD